MSMGGYGQPATPSSADPGIVPQLQYVPFCVDCWKLRFVDASLKCFILSYAEI